MHDLYVAEIYQSGAIFLLSSFTSTQRAAEEKPHRTRWFVTVVQGHSTPSKLVPTESPYASDFLLVSHCYMHVVSET